MNLSMTLSIQTKTDSGLIVLLLAAHGSLELEHNIMAASGYIFLEVQFNIFMCTLLLFY